MRRPPAVAWDLVPARWQLRVLSALVLFAGLVWAGFVVQQGWVPASIALLAAVLASACMAALAWHNRPNGQLRWDGEQWLWFGVQDRMIRSMVCVLDLQSVVLLYIRCDQGKRHWLWLEAGHKPGHWKALRRAIVASKPSSPDGANAEPQEG